MDWTKLTKKPTDKVVQEQIADYLLSLREIVSSGDRRDYVIKHVMGRSVLDIGVCGGAEADVTDPGWLHRRVTSVSPDVAAVDILEDDVNRLRAFGFNAHCMDATGEGYLGRKFERVLMGDVIEHVDNPVALLRFAARHLSSGGLALVSSPNPHYYRHRRMVASGAPIVRNMEHVIWLSPYYAMEAGRRAELKLVRYACFINRTRLWKRRLLRLPPSEEYTADYVYLYERATNPSGD